MSIETRTNATPDPGRPRPRKRRRWLRGLLLLGLLFTLALAGLYLTRERSVAPYLIRKAQATLRDEYGCELEIERVAGNWWSELRLEGVRLERLRGDFPVESLRGATVRAEYSLLELARGELRGLRALTVRADELALDLTGDSAVDEPSSGAPDFGWFDELPAGSVTLGELRIRAAGTQESRATAIRLDSRPAADGTHFELEVGELQHHDAVLGTLQAPLVTGGRLAAGAVELEHLRLGDDIVTGSGRVSLPGEGSLDFAAVLRLQVADGTLALDGRLREGRATLQLDVADIDLGVLARLATRPVLEGGRMEAHIETALDLGDLAASSGAARARVTAPQLDGRIYDDLELDASLADGRVTVPRLRLHALGEELLIEDALFPLEELGRGELPRKATGRLQLVTQFFAKSAWEAIRPVGAPLEVEQFSLAGSVDGGRLIVSQGEILTSVGRIDLFGGTIEAPPSTGSTTGPLLIDAVCNLTLGVAVPDLAFVGTWIGGAKWSGTARADATVTGPLERPRFDVSLTGENLVLHGFELETLQAEGTVDFEALALRQVHARRGPWELSGAGTWVFESGQVSGVELNAASAEVALLARGDLRLPTSERGLVVALQGLEAERLGQRMTLVEQGAVTIGEEGIATPPIVLESELGRASIASTATDTGTRLDLGLEQFDPMPLFGGLLPEGLHFSGVDLDASIWIGEELTAGGDVRIADLRLPGLGLGATGEPRRGTLESSFELRAGRLLIGSLALVEEGLGELHASGSIPRPSGADWARPGAVELELTAELTDLHALGELLASPVLRSGRARLETSITGEWTALAGRLALTANALVLAPNGLNEAPPLDVAAELELGERLRIASLTIDGASGSSSFDFSGDLDLPADLPARLAGWPDDVLDAPVDLEAEVLVSEPASLVAELGSFERLRGVLTGQLTVRGTLRRPELGGRVSARDTEVRFAGNLPALRDVSAELELDGREVHVRSLTGELGGAPVSVSGSFPLDASGKLALQLVGTDVLLHRSRGMLARADAELRIGGTPLRPRVTGSVVLTSGRFVESVDLIGSATANDDPFGNHPLDFALSRTPPLSDVELDVTIRSKSDFPIKNNLMRGGIRPDLRIVGRGEAPVLVGTVYLAPTTLKLPSGTLQLSSGLILFRQDAPLAPELALSGSAKMRGYDLQVAVTGNMQHPEVQVSSSPPLAAEDALLLLLTGRLPEQLTALEAGQTVAVYLARDWLAREFAGDADGTGETVFDRIDLEIGGDVSRSGLPTYLVRYRFEGDQYGEGRARYLTTERDVYDRTNFGYRIVLRRK